jgi:hypothetical protein
MKSENIILAIFLVVLLSGCVSNSQSRGDVQTPKIGYVPDSWILREDSSLYMTVVFEPSKDPADEPDFANYIEISYVSTPPELVGKDNDYEAQKDAATTAFRNRLDFEPTEWTPIIIDGKKTPHMFGKRGEMFTCVDYSVHGPTLLKLYAQHEPGGELHENLVRVAESITFE